MKEVVHVPTLELAEKVLKVAEEQGMYNKDIDYMFKSCEDLLCLEFDFKYKVVRWSPRDWFIDEGYKVITAEEFLSRYKPKFKPIAMRCSREQFEAVRPKLEKLGEIGELIDAFDKHEYLTNNYNIGCKLFDFIDDSSDWVDFHENNIHHDWDEAVFLKHCWYIEEEPTELEQLRKENHELKEKLKAMQEQPKVGDLCLFWNDSASDYSLGLLYEYSDEYYWSHNTYYDNCLKATDENLKKVIEEIKLNKNNQPNHS